MPRGRSWRSIGTSRSTAASWSRKRGAPSAPGASTRPATSAPSCTPCAGTASPATDPNLFQSPFRAGIKIDAYQMEPLRKALRLPRVNLFIADDTGLGKTIEAGLIARELLLRKKAKTVVVAAPASVLEQWEGRDGGTLRPPLRNPRPRVSHPGSPGAGLRRQSVAYPQPISRLAQPSHRPDLRGPHARMARRDAAGRPADPGRGPPRRRRRVAAVTESRRSSPVPSAISEVVSSTACSCPPRLTTAIPTVSPPCSSCSIHTASLAGCRSGARTRSTM